MIEVGIRKAIYVCHQQGMSIGKISRQFQLSKNTVRLIIKQKGESSEKPREDKIGIDIELLNKLYKECEGWIQRVHEKLKNSKLKIIENAAHMMYREKSNEVYKIILDFFK